MRRSTRYVSMLVIVLSATLSSIYPVSAQPRVPARSVDRLHVHGHDTGASRVESTSFQLFGSRFASKGTPLDAGGSSAMSPRSVSGFDGLSDPSSQPSDTTGALGETFIVAAVNTKLAVFDRTGTTIVPPTQLDTLNPDSDGHFVFDPKVVYDAYADTFVVAYLVQDDSPRFSRIITVAIPGGTADDVGTWCSTSFPGDAVRRAPALWADFPGLGFNDDRVTITTNQFEFPSSVGRFRYSQVMTIDKSALYDCGVRRPTPTVFAGTATRDDHGDQAFTLRPAESTGTAPGAQLMVSFTSVPGRGDYLTLWRIQSTAAGSGLRKVSRPTGKVSVPPAGTQAGGDVGRPGTWWDTGDARLINAFYDAARNELFTAHTVLKDLKPDTRTNGYPEAVNRWYEVDPAAKIRRSVIARKGIVGDPEVDVGWPSVATDSSGLLFVTYNRASEPRNEFLSAWVSTILPDKTSGADVLLRAGAATYDAKPGVERWGDFTAINRDPTDGRKVATFNQYAQSSSLWRQFISIVTDD